MNEHRLGARLADGLNGLIAAVRPRAVAICHCHYPELVGELAAVLERLPSRCAVHVSSADPEVLSAWKETWQRRDTALSLHVVENRGRDVRPFFHVLRRIRVPDSTPILKIHGKRSTYSPRGDAWRRDLLASLVPDRQTARAVIDRFHADRRVGMIGPDGSFTSRAVYWGGNRQLVASFMEAAGAKPPPDHELGFFAGTMFWIRASLARRLGAHVDPSAFPEELGQRDGTYAHALERALPMAARALGYDLYEMSSSTPLRPEHGRDREVTYI